MLVASLYFDLPINTNTGNTQSFVADLDRIFEERKQESIVCVEFDGI